MCVDVGYAEQVITQSGNYCGLEVEGVRSFRMFDGFEHIEVCNENPELYSVYIRESEGQACCIGDFSTHDKAVTYAIEVRNRYLEQNWPVLDRYSHYQTLNS